MFDAAAAFGLAVRVVVCRVPAGARRQREADEQSGDGVPGCGGEQSWRPCSAIVAASTMGLRGPRWAARWACAGAMPRQRSGPASGRTPPRRDLVRGGGRPRLEGEDARVLDDAVADSIAAEISLPGAGPPATGDRDLVSATTRVWSSVVVHTATDLGQRRRERRRARPLKRDVDEQGPRRGARLEKRLLQDERHAKPTEPTMRSGRTARKLGIEGQARPCQMRRAQRPGVASAPTGSPRPSRRPSRLGRPSACSTS